MYSHLQISFTYQKKRISELEEDDYQRPSPDDKEAWIETVEERRFMIRAFEKTGISLKVNGSEDQAKMQFQGRSPGISSGLNI